MRWRIPPHPVEPRIRVRDLVFLVGHTQQTPGDTATREEAIYHHPDGSMSYTPTGESQSHVLSPVELGQDPFPGAPLTVDQIIAMADAMPADSMAAAGPAAAPAAAVG